VQALAASTTTARLAHAKGEATRAPRRPPPPERPVSGRPPEVCSALLLDPPIVPRCMSGEAAEVVADRVPLDAPDRDAARSKVEAERNVLAKPGPLLTQRVSPPEGHAIEQFPTQQPAAGVDGVGGKPVAHQVRARDPHSGLDKVVVVAARLTRITLPRARPGEVGRAVGTQDPPPAVHRLQVRLLYQRSNHLREVARFELVVVIEEREQDTTGGARPDRACAGCPSRPVGRDHGCGRRGVEYPQRNSGRWSACKRVEAHASRTDARVADHYVLHQRVLLRMYRRDSPGDVRAADGRRGDYRDQRLHPPRLPPPPTHALPSHPMRRALRQVSDRLAGVARDLVVRADREVGRRLEWGLAGGRPHRWRRALQERWNTPIPVLGPPAFWSRDAMWTVMMSQEDQYPYPNDRLLNLAFAAAERARGIDLGWLSDRASAEEGAYVDHWPGEHYRFLAGCIEQVRPQLVVEIGTFTGLSALAMKSRLPESGRIVTYDVAPWDSFGDTALTRDDLDGRLEQRIGDLGTTDFFSAQLDTLAAADLVLLDGPKDGRFEPAFLRRYLPVLSGRATMVIDDIRFVNMIQLWRDLPLPKLDVTSFGHWTGTGLVVAADNALERR